MAEYPPPQEKKKGESQSKKKDGKSVFSFLIPGKKGTSCGLMTI